MWFFYVMRALLRRSALGVWVGIAMVCLSSISGNTQSVGEGVTPGISSSARPLPEFKINLATHKLANGLEVVVLPDHRAPVVTHMIWYKIGSADEAPGESGLAHFLEHLMFKGTPTYPGDVFSKTVAALGGQENAFTSSDYTAYYQQVPKKHLRQMMQFESDRMVNLDLKKEMILAERNVILEERALRVDSHPEAQLEESLDALLFINHPYGRPVIGWTHEIEALDADKAMRFYRTYYAPNNAILVVAGDVIPEEVFKMAEETYGRFSANPSIPTERQRPKEPPLPGLRKVSLADPRVQQESLQRVWLAPSVTTSASEAYALEVLAEILGGGQISWLYRSLVFEQAVALSVSAWFQDFSVDATRFGIYAIPAENIALEVLEERLEQSIETLLEEGLTEALLERSKYRILAQAVYMSDQQARLARLFGSGLTTGQSVEALQAWPQKIAQVTLEEVRKAGRLYLARGKGVVAFLCREEQCSGQKGTEVRAEGGSPNSVEVDESEAPPVVH